MFPSVLASKVKPYEIEFGNATVKVDVLDPFWTSGPFLLQKVEEIEKKLTPERRVVGIGFKHDSTFSYCWLLLCVGNHCLVIKLFQEPNSALPFYDSVCLERLIRLLSDQTTCFVGVNIDTSKLISKLEMFRLPCNKKYNPMPDIKAVETDHFVARFCHKPGLLSCGSVEKMATEAGLDIKPNIIVKSIDWKAKVFSDDEIKFAIYDVYYSYLMADKLMTS